MKLIDNEKEIVFVTKEQYEASYSIGALEEDKYFYVTKENPKRAKSDCDMRIPQLKAMHSFCCNSNDEEITMNWLGIGIPDGADIWDYISIATDDSLYEDICKAFKACVNSTGWEY